MLLVGGGVGVVVIWIGSFVLFKMSFRYRASVAIPMGESPDDVLWVDDKFKTRNKKGHVQVSFLKTKGKAYSPPYRWWSKWLKPNKSLPEADGNGWYDVKDADIRKHLYRGAFFYKVSDDELMVMKIKTPGEFTVLDHNSKELIIDDIERQNEITVSFKDKLVQLGMWLGSLLIISLLAIVVFVLSTKYAGEQAANIIQLAQQAAFAQPGVGG